MKSVRSRRIFLTSVAALVGSTALAGAPATSLRPVSRAGDLRKAPGADRLLRDAKISGIVGYAVVDVRSGQLLEEHASAAALPPASVAKAVTALYALDTLGSDARFTTRVLATGGVSGGIVQGDLILAGGGDPTLDTERLALLAQRLKAAGVTGVKGDFKVWGGALPYAKVIDKEQPDHVGYNPSISGLNLNYNRVHFGWRRASGSYEITMDARSANYRPAVRVARMDLASRAAPVYTYRDAGSHDQWSVSRGALGQKGGRWLPVRKPELYAGEVFQSLARVQGITLGSPKVLKARPGGQEVARVSSDSVDVLVRGMLKFSTNITAEALGMAASAKRRGKPANLVASAREMTRWAKATLGMGTSTKFVDHSGLGDASRVTAADMAKALRAARGRTPIRSLMKEIPMRDANRNVLKNHPVKVDAKTGTLNFVSGLGGYATAENGRELAFAIFAADTTRRAALDRNQRERPEGGRAYNRRAKALQQRLLQRWGRIYA